MKKFMFVLPVIFFLFSGYAHSEQDAESVEVCTNEAKLDNIPSEKIKEYINSCVEAIASDEKRLQEEVNKS